MAVEAAEVGAFERALLQNSTTLGGGSAGFGGGAGGGQDFGASVEASAEFKLTRDHATFARIDALRPSFVKVAFELNVEDEDVEKVTMMLVLLLVLSLMLPLLLLTRALSFSTQGRSLDRRASRALAVYVDAPRR